MDEAREVNSAFPEALKEPILRRIQFSTVSRVDNLGGWCCTLLWRISTDSLLAFSHSGRDLRGKYQSFLAAFLIYPRG